MPKPGLKTLCARAGALATSGLLAFALTLAATSPLSAHAQTDSPAVAAGSIAVGCPAPADGPGIASRSARKVCSACRA